MTKYSGLNKITGKTVSDIAHLQQSVGDILTTPIGSRVMRREYGSHLFALIDQPANGAGLMRLKAAAADALMRWESRIRLSHISANVEASGRLMLSITGRVVGLGEVTIREGISSE